MRFKLKLKKSRQYNVTSRNLFVAGVEHLIGELWLWGGQSDGTLYVVGLSSGCVFVCDSVAI